MRFSILLGILLFSSSAFSNVEYYEPHIQTSTHPGVKFTLLVQDYKVTYSSTKYNIGNRAIAQYETNSLATLEDYAVVQFIRGCQFNTYVEDKKVHFVDNIARVHFDEVKIFNHRDWVIDSTDKDPMYSNVTKEELPFWKSRHGWYFWNKFGNYDEKGEVYYGKEKPKKPYLYVMVYPGTSFIQDGWAKNISLEYQTCLFRTKDIPEEGVPHNISFAQPIQCFEWRSSFIYDHFTGKIQSPEGIHPHCSR
jgi:hypothetical protein